MSEFWTWEKFVSWENCIESNRLCNLENCPDTLNCCVTNCIGTPTIKGIILGLFITAIVMFILLWFNAKFQKEPTKSETNNE